MNKFELKRSRIPRVWACVSLLALGFSAQAAEYHERLTPVIKPSPFLVELYQTALKSPTEENVKVYLLAYREEVGRAQKFEEVKESVLSKNPELKTFYEQHEMTLRVENARKRFIEEQYQSAFRDNLGCQKPLEDPSLK